MTDVAGAVPSLDLSDYLSVRAAGRRKGVSHEALRLAIKRGQLRGLAVNARLTLIHKADLRGYRPKKDRQRAGRAAAKARAVRARAKRR